jgi:hypothetical protein
VSKPFWKSKTFQGLAITCAGILLNFLSRKGYVGSAEYQDLLELISYLANAFGITYSAYGRVKANGTNISLR